MSRIVWVHSHVRRLPDRIHTPPHEELQAAFVQDIRNDPKRLESALAKEMYWELDLN